MILIDPINVKSSFCGVENFRLDFPPILEERRPNFLSRTFTAPPRRVTPRASPPAHSAPISQIPTTFWSPSSPVGRS